MVPLGPREPSLALRLPVRIFRTGVMLTRPQAITTLRGLDHEFDPDGHPVDRVRWHMCRGRAGRRLARVQTRSACSSITAEALALPLRVAWEYRCAQPPNPAWPDTFRLLNRTDFDYAPHPVIARGLVCFGSSADDTVRALEAKTGAEKWRFTASGPVRLAPQIDGGKVFFAADDGRVYCLDAGTGNLLWKFQAAPHDERMVGNHRMISRWPVRTGVLVDEGVAYCVAGMWNMEGVFVYALRADTGQVVWCNDTLGLSGVTIVDFPESADPAHQAVGGHNGEFAANGAVGANPQGPLLLSGDTLVVPNGNSAPTALDRRTGVLSPRGCGGGTPVTIDRDKVYSFYRHHEDILALNPFSLSGGTSSRGWGKRAIPQVKITPPKLGQIRDRCKVSAVVHDGKLYARKAYGLALADDVLLIGEEGAVLAQDPDTERGAVAGRRDRRGPRDRRGRWTHVRRHQQRCDLLLRARGQRVGAGSGGSRSGGAVASGCPALAVAGSREWSRQLHEAGMDRGFALVVGDADGQLSTTLAAHTLLRIVNVLPDEAAAAALCQRLLDQTTWYGTRVHVQTVARLDRLPFAQFFANAVIVAGPAAGLSGKELYRVLRPCGGMLLAPGLTPAEAESLLKDCGAAEGEVRQSPEGGLVVRGKLPGALDRDSAVRSGPRADQRVKWPLRPLWYGGPGTRQVQGVHVAGVPVVSNGRYFVQGEQSLTAVDAYNGAILWSHALPLSAPDYSIVDGVIYPAADPTKFESLVLLRTSFHTQVQADNQFVYLQLGSAYFQNVGDEVSKTMDQAMALEGQGGRLHPVGRSARASR